MQANRDRASFRLANGHKREAVRARCQVREEAVDHVAGAWTDHGDVVACGPALPEQGRLQILAFTREVPGPLPLADVLEDGAVGDMPGVNRGHSNGIEQVATMSAGHQPKRNRHVGRAKCRYAYAADRLTKLCRDNGRLIDPRGLALVATGADGRESLDVLDRLHASTEGLPYIRDRDVALQVDEMGRPILAVTWDDPVRHDRALTATVQVSGGRADHLDVWGSAVGHEARQAFVVAKAPLRLAEEMNRWVEAAGNAQQVALDLAARGVAGEGGDGDGGKSAPTRPSPASGGGECLS